MDREAFWHLIEAPDLSGLAGRPYTAALARRLEQLEAVEIVSFENHANQCMAEINTCELYDILFIVEDCYAHDDEFWKFMQGVVAQGRKCFESVRDCPALVGEFTPEQWPALDRALLPAARRAFEAKTGLPPYRGFETGAPADSGNRRGKHRNRQALRRRYPDLWYRFSLWRKLPSVNPAWLTWNNGTVRRLAESIDAERRFGDLPVLADALEEARCRNATILAHCRAGVSHPGRCWVIELLLGRLK